MLWRHGVDGERQRDGNLWNVDHRVGACRRSTPPYLTAVASFSDGQCPFGRWLTDNLFLRQSGVIGNEDEAPTLNAVRVLPPPPVVLPLKNGRLFVFPKFGRDECEQLVLGFRALLTSQRRGSDSL